MLFEIELIGKVDVGFAVEEVAEIQPRSFEVYGVDLKVAPIERAIRVVVIGFAFALRIFGALDRKRNAAVGAELLACVLLVDGERVALVLLRLERVFGASAQADYNRGLKVKPQRRLQAERVPRVNGYYEADESHADQQGQAAKSRAREPVGPVTYWSSSPGICLALRGRPPEERSVEQDTGHSLTVY